MQLLHPRAIIIELLQLIDIITLVGLLHLLNLHHWGRLRTVYNHLDGHFIPEVAIHSQVETIFKMSWKHAIAEVAQHNRRPSKQALGNVSSRKHVFDTTIYTWRCYACVLSVTMILECIKQFIAIPFVNLVITFNWFQESSDLMFFTPCQAGSCLIRNFKIPRSNSAFATLAPSICTIHQHRCLALPYTKPLMCHQGDEPTLDTCSIVCQTDITHR